MKIAPVIIALDMKKLTLAKNFIDKFNKPVWFKIGMEFIYANDFKIIKYLHQKGHKVFLDLKIFDIPNTAKEAVDSMAKYKPEFISVHALGGKEMLKSVLKKAGSSKVLAVTLLTSVNKNTLKNDLNIDGEVSSYVNHLAKIAKSVGITHLVCSPYEAKRAKDLGFITITPGIRRNVDVKNDQKRFATPKEAKNLGSDYIVVGRPITLADDPVSVYNIFVKEFNNG